MFLVDFHHENFTCHIFFSTAVFTDTAGHKQIRNNRYFNRHKVNCLFLNLFFIILNTLNVINRTHSWQPAIVFPPSQLFSSTASPCLFVCISWGCKLYIVYSVCMCANARLEKSNQKKSLHLINSLIILTKFKSKKYIGHFGRFRALNQLLRQSTHQAISKFIIVRILLSIFFFKL